MTLGTEDEFLVEGEDDIIDTDEEEIQIASVNDDGDLKELNFEE